jgi:hypothetical protein
MRAPSDRVTKAADSKKFVARLRPLDGAFMADSMTTLRVPSDLVSINVGDGSP